MRVISRLILGLFLATFAGTASAQSFTTHVYQWMAGSFTWQQAKADAESRGGHLVTVTSDAERLYIINLGVIPGGGRFWMGATDEGHEGTWTWITGESFAYTHWFSGEPNNVSGLENHMTGISSTLEWNDETAITPHPYLLEFDECTPRPAKATVNLVGNFVVGASLTDGGCGYTNPPAITIFGLGGSGATGYTQISAGVVTNIVITSTGSGYPPGTLIYVAPPIYPAVSIVQYSTNAPSAKATPVIVNGFVVGATLTAQGSGYTTVPTVTINDTTGVGAIAYAQVSNGSVTNIGITNPGSGYSAGTTINIQAAPVLTAVVPSATQLMTGQAYQMQTTSDLTNWTPYGVKFTATTNFWLPTNYWNAAATNRLYFRFRFFQ